MAHDVFISYSSKDKTIADAVCARLEARGIRCWIAPRDVQPGAPYGEEIIDGIHNSRVMVLVLSANANASPHIPKEVERAVSHGVPIIPLRVEDVTPAKSLDYFISSVHWLDAITPPFESHLEGLATTIRTLLPEGSPKTIPSLEPMAHAAIAAPVTTAAPSVTAGNARPSWLYPAIGVAVLALASAGWYFLGRAPGTPAGEQPVVIITPPSANPSPVNPSKPRPSAPVPAAPRLANGGGASQPLAEADPILGCWRSLNNTPVVVNPDGTLNAGPFTARWRHLGGSIYTFTWPEAVDSVRLTPDGNGMSGGNQYGVALTASRVSPGQDAVGEWRWYNGVIITISPNGALSGPGLSGKWQNIGPGAYTFTWPNPIDTVIMSSDHQHVSGQNQYGFRMGGTKSACGG